MSARSVFELTIKGEDPPPETNTYLDKVSTSTVVKKTLLQGTATDQMTVLFREDTGDFGTLAASATRAIDLLLALDAFGTALGLSDVALLYIEHKATSLSSSISIQAAAADGFTSLMGTTAALTLRPGDWVLVSAFTAGNLPVAGGDKIIDIINGDGVNAADYVIEVWGR